MLLEICVLYLVCLLVLLAITRRREALVATALSAAAVLLLLAAAYVRQVRTGSLPGSLPVVVEETKGNCGNEQ
jgi:hypothetical protein